MLSTAAGRRKGNQGFVGVSRYPGEDVAVDEDEYKDAVEIAQMAIPLLINKTTASSDLNAVFAPSPLPLPELVVERELSAIVTEQEILSS